MMHAEPINISWNAPGPPSLQRLIRVLSGLLVLFVAFGAGSWFSGLCSWIGFYLGARATALTAVAQHSAVIGFGAAVAGCLVWHRARIARGRRDLPFWTAPAAALALLLGNIFWAVFVDAIAWHYGSDIVRPAFDHAIMYLVLGATLPMAVMIPWLLTRMERRFKVNARPVSP
jgi:hypothetical protein